MRAMITTWPARMAASYQAMSGSWSITVNETIRRSRAMKPCTAPVVSKRDAPSSPRRIVMSRSRTPAAFTAAAAFAALSASGRTARSESVGYPMNRDGRRPRGSVI
jgi:hypothetical protein